MLMGGTRGSQGLTLEGIRCLVQLPLKVLAEFRLLKIFCCLVKNVCMYTRVHTCMSLTQAPQCTVADSGQLVGGLILSFMGL